MRKHCVFGLPFLLLMLDPVAMAGQTGAFNHFPLKLTTFPVSVNVKDTIRKSNLMINPFKFFFNEISVSYEQFRSIKWIKPSASDLTGIDSIINKRKTKYTSSANWIFGLHFPSDYEHSVSYKQDINYSCLTYLGDAGMSPFINWGLSVKLELRRYRNTFYYGPQFMEKFVFYPKTVVYNKYGTLEDGVVRLQSGYANVVGCGYFIGWQKVTKGFVTDLFLGVGARYRLAIRKIHEEQNLMGPNVIFPDPKTENLSRAYPALNFGLRLGFML